MSIGKEDPTYGEQKLLNKKTKARELNKYKIQEKLSEIKQIWKYILK